MDNFIGKKIEQFLIEAFVGKGKTGAVYQARDLNLNRAVAVKLLSPELAVQPAIQQQLSQAARAVSSLTHPSIVPLYNFGRQNGRVYMVMDFVNGMSLETVLQRLTSHRQLMPLDETLHLVAQAADALSAAHQEGALHLNLKPSNILLKRQHRSARPGESSLRAMLTDFGLSFIPPHGLQSGLQTTTIDLGANFPYLCPEQCTNTAVDGRADIYSLGAILYQLLSGRPPFDIRSATEAIMRHSVETPLPLCELRPELPAAVANIAHTALAKNPAHRYQLAEQMADALRQAMRTTAVSEAPATRVFSAIQEASARLPVASQAANYQEALPTHVLPPLRMAGHDASAAPAPQQPPEPATPPPQAPAPRLPVYNSSELALSETMPAQPRFDTPVFDVPAGDKQITPKPQPEQTPPFVNSLHTSAPALNPSATTPPIAGFAFQQAGTTNAPLAEPLTDIHRLDAPEQDTRIVIIRQGRGPRQVSLKKSQILIGRAKDNDIVLNARDVSRYHARLDWVNGRWRITDLDSSGGTFGNGHRLALNEPAPWTAEQILQIGPYFLHWAAASEVAPDSRANDEPKTELFQVSADASQVQSTSGRFSVALHPALITMLAGDQATVQVELFNQGAATDTLKLALSGLPSGTYTMTQHFVTLAPGARASIPLSLNLPASGTLMSYRIAAGNYPFELLIHSKTQAEETAVIAGLLLVTTLEEFSLGIWPSQVMNGENIRILIRNEGNVTNSYNLVARDARSLLQFGGQRGRIQLKPGEAVTQVVTLQARQRPLFGREQEIPFEVEVRTENGQQQMKAGIVRVSPQIPGWALWLSAAIFVLLLGVLLVTAVFTQNQTQLNTSAPHQATPAGQPLSHTISLFEN